MKGQRTPPQLDKLTEAEHMAEARARLGGLRNAKPKPYKKREPK